MTMWNDRLLPYPLLAPWTDDYGDSEFVVTVPHAVLNNGKQISLTIKYRLTSRYLRQMVAKGKANYVGQVSCSKTFSRTAYITSQEDDVQTLDAGNYAEEIRLTPYVISSQRIEGFCSEEFAEEFRNARPEGFSIAPGSILAVGDSMTITLEEGGSPYSVIDLVPDDNIGSGSFEVILDDNRIKIHVNPEDKQRIEAFRQRGEGSREMAVLFPAIYLHAVTEALRSLGDDPDKHWDQTLRTALERHEITDDPQEIKFRALRHAQKLMEMPMGTLLTAFGSGEEE